MDGNIPQCSLKHYITTPRELPNVRRNQKLYCQKDSMYGSTQKYQRQVKSDHSIESGIINQRRIGLIVEVESIVLRRLRVKRD